MKRYLGVGVVVVVLMLVAIFVAIADGADGPLSVRAVAAAAPVIEIGVPLTGENAYETI